jgi:pyridoxal phosphate enzyme (YggS family)
VSQERIAASFSTLPERYDEVMWDVASAARDAGRDPASITVIVVTKFHPAAVVRELAAIGAHDVGENRHQEAAAKALAVNDPSLTWHFIGQLQSNKAAAALEYASIIHSVDRESLVDSLDRAAKPVDVFLQLNLTDDPHRGGVQPADLEPLAERVLASSSLRLRGLMAVAPLDAEPRRAFATVRSVSERLQVIAPEATALSMGMSGDYRDAVLEGATHLRIGTAITGNRPPHG